MSKTVLITDIAKVDIGEITQYIAKDNKVAAYKIVDDLYKTFDLILDYLEIGIYKNGIKDRTIKIYTVKKKLAIVYRISQDSIEILRVLTRYQNIFAILN